LTFWHFTNRIIIIIIIIIISHTQAKPGNRINFIRHVYSDTQYALSLLYTFMQEFMANIPKQRKEKVN